MNKTFCILPWVHTHIKPNGDVHLCSRKSIPLGNTNEQTFDEIYNSSKMVDIRQRMIDGKEVSGCEKCYHEETIKHTSQRLLLNKWFKEYLLNGNILPWKEDSDSFYKDSSEQDWNKIFEDVPVGLRWLALHGSNVCNLACRGCYSLLSTKWRKDDAKMGNSVHPLQNPSIESYGIDINNVDMITMFGGEPFYMKQSTELDVKMKNDPVQLSKKILQYFTNGTVLPTPEILETWKHVRKLILYISIDAYGDDNDYFRYGSDWQKVVNNLHFYIAEGAKHGWEIKISTLVNIYNVDKLDVLHEWLAEQGIADSAVMYNLCIYPQELDIRNLPNNYKQELIEKYDTINLPSNVRSMVQNHLKVEQNLSSFVAVKGFSETLDDLRKQQNPNTKLEKYFNDDNIKPQ